jgi:dipeptidyl aminopeptidase/acylaminoacyl peptidase
VAFVVTTIDAEANEYRSRIWLAPVDGSEPPWPFTAGETRDLAPRWSPDGKRLAHVAARPKEGSQVRVLPVATGGEAIVCASSPEVVSELAWSPDGRTLAFVARDPDRDRYGEPGQRREEKDMPPRRVKRLFSRLNGEDFVFDRPSRVFVAPADGSGTARALTLGEFEASQLAWSPDSLRIAFASARHETWDLDLACDLWTVQVNGKEEPQRLTDTTAGYGYPSFSPDGRLLAYLVDPTPRDGPRHGQLGVLDLGTGERTELTTKLDRNCTPYPLACAPVWDRDHLLFTVEDAGNVHILRAPADASSPPVPVVGGERWVGGFDLVGRTLAFAASTPTAPAEIFVATDGGNGARRLTDLGAAFTERVELGPPVRFTATSGDGTEVECWAIAPVGGVEGGRAATLLNVHGGPFTQYGNRFFDEFQMQAGAGFGVVYCNPRGSSGYSESYGRAIRWPEWGHDPGSGWGGVDYDDVMACIDEACRRFDWIDPHRLGVLGGSYGGFMTSWIVGHSDRFKAACSERAANNLLTLEYNSDIASVFRNYVGVSHVDNPEAYLRQSPSRFVEQMTTPLLLVHSEADLRCPIEQAEELFVALRLLGREPELVRFPGENHDLSRSGSPRHRLMRAEIVREWFAGRLGEG